MNIDEIDPLRASVALCNNGVTLVQRCDYVEAQRIFREGIHELKHVRVQPNHPKCTAIQHQCCKNEILYTSTNPSANEALHSKPATSSAPFDIHTFQDDVDPFQLEIEMKEMFYADNIYLVKLFSICLYVPTTTEAIENKKSFVSAITLQNMASTFLCLSHNVDYPEETADAMLEGAHKLYCSSERILWNLIEKQDTDILPEALASLSIVLLNQIQTSLYLGIHTENREYREKLVCVRQLMQRLTSLGFYGSGSSAAPSA